MAKSTTAVEEDSSLIAHAFSPDLFCVLCLVFAGHACQHSPQGLCSCSPLCPALCLHRALPEGPCPRATSLTKSASLLQESVPVKICPLTQSISFLSSETDVKVLNIQCLGYIFSNFSPRHAQISHKTRLGRGAAPPTRGTTAGS